MQSSLLCSSTLLILCICTDESGCSMNLKNDKQLRELIAGGYACASLWKKSLLDFLCTCLGLTSLVHDIFLRLVYACSDGNADKDLFTLSEVDFSLNGGETLLVSSYFLNFVLMIEVLLFSVG